MEVTMNLRLLSGNVCVATKTLKTPADYDRVSDASMLVFQGRHFSFAGLRRDSVDFTETDGPVIVDGFVTPWAGGNG